MSAHSMEVFAAAHRADLLEEAETRALVHPRRSEREHVAATSIRERIRVAIERRLSRPTAAS
jgi:hypothetical protein